MKILNYFRIRFTFFLIGLGLGTLFCGYIWTLSRQVMTAFHQIDEFIPTRLYSDVTKISPPQSRTAIEKRLRDLAYNFSNNGNITTFDLHSTDYPSYLIPENHPILLAKARRVNFIWESTQPNAALQKIEFNGLEIPDLYLEPEVVAILTRTGEQRRQIRTALKFEEVPALLWKAIIAIEDQHFLDHRGFDPKGFARAIWVNLRTLSFAQGGSTITQQLIKNLMTRRTKNVIQKINELFLALILESRVEKEQILERYLNEVYLGQVGGLEVHGVAEGAENFFGKRVEDLNLAEMALMAGLIRGPGFYSPYKYRERAVERQKLVLKKMVETGQIAEGEAEAALKMPIRLAPPQTSATRAPFFSDYVKAELFSLLKNKMTEQEVMRAGFRVYTTLNPTLNSLAQNQMTQGIAGLEESLKVTPEERLEGALAMVDHTTGAIRALIGGKNYSQSNFNRILNMKRQVGSTFKPFVFLTAFQKGTDSQGVPYSPIHPAEDAPWTLVFDRGRQNWTPKNYERGFRGWVSYRQALALSINTVTAKLGYEIGPEAVIATSKALGVQSALPAVPSLSLGVAELSPIELLQAYANLANHGVQNDLFVIRGIMQQDGSEYLRFAHYPKKVFEPAPVDLLIDILQDGFNYGTAAGARKLGFQYPAAGKTGTTSNHRDAWFAGFTPHYTTVVWVGMDHPSEKKTTRVHLTGGKSALPIWTKFMNAALTDEQALPFPKSPLLTEILADRHTGKKAESGCPLSQVVLEKFIQGQEPKDSSCQPQWPASAPQTVEDNR